MGIAQAGEADQARLGIVLSGHAGKCSQCHLVHATALVGHRPELCLGAFLGQREVLERPRPPGEHGARPTSPAPALQVLRLRQNPRGLLIGQARGVCVRPTLGVAIRARGASAAPQSPSGDSRSFLTRAWLERSKHGARVGVWLHLKEHASKVS